jgi:hypothetical protein
MDLMLDRLMDDTSNSLVEIDFWDPHAQFQPGVGPYGEPQLIKRVAASLNRMEAYGGEVVTKRTTDLLIPGA